MKKLIRKLGYGIAIHFNEYTSNFEIYEIGSCSPKSTLKGDSRYVENKNLKKAIKSYIKRFK